MKLPSQRDPSATAQTLGKREQPCSARVRRKLERVLLSLDSMYRGLNLQYSFWEMLQYEDVRAIRKTRQGDTTTNHSPYTLNP